MKIARYRYRNEETYGIIDKESILSIPNLAKQLKRHIPQSLEGFITGGKKSLATAEQLMKETDRTKIENIPIPLTRVTLLAPIPNPPKILCLGLNYRDHAAETKARIPDEPIMFMKPHTTIIGPYQKIIKPKFVKELDYEGELAIIIGKTAKNISPAEAKEHILGYTIFNDISARDFQFKDGQWTRGKSFDTFAPTGPWITTEDQLSTDNLSIRTWVNEELRQNGTTRNMVFDVNQIVHQLSRIMTLEPCDIIATGTPAGVAFAMNTKKFLQGGDSVRIEIEGIGELENNIEER